MEPGPPLKPHEAGRRERQDNRSQLQNLLTFCRLNKGRVHFIVVFNLTRFARDKYGHFALRSHCNRSAFRCDRRRSRSTIRPLVS